MGGLCLATTRQTDDGSRGRLIAVVYATLAQDFGVKAIGLASQHYYTGSDTWVRNAAATIPVPTGQSFQYAADPTSPDPSFFCEYIPFSNNAAPELGKWVQVLTRQTPPPSEDDPTSGNLQSAPSDGFVLANVNCHYTDGARGWIELQDQDGNRLAGASAHYFTGGDRYVPWNSFCFPIRSGVQWKFVYEATSAGAIFDGWWIPFGTTPSFGPPSLVVPTLKPVQAATDGFLSGWVHARANGDRGSIDVRTASVPSMQPPPDPFHIKSASLVNAASSAHYYLGSDMHIRTNSAMIPVKSGWWYQVTTATTYGQPSYQAVFTPAANLFAP